MTATEILTWNHFLEKFLSLEINLLVSLANHIGLKKIVSPKMNLSTEKILLITLANMVFFMLNFSCEIMIFLEGEVNQISSLQINISSPITMATSFLQFSSSSTFLWVRFFFWFFFPALPDPESADAANAPFTLNATNISAQRIQPN